MILYFVHYHEVIKWNINNTYYIIVNQNIGINVRVLLRNYSSKDIIIPLFALSITEFSNVVR